MTSVKTNQRAMALDVGDVRIGIALSDPLRLFAQPLVTIARKKDQNTVREIVALMLEHEVTTLVVGLPNYLSGESAPQGDKTRSFAERLDTMVKKKLPWSAEVVFWDERLTSVQAERIIAGSKLKNSERHAAIDRISAAIILDGYLQSNESARETDLGE